MKKQILLLAVFTLATLFAGTSKVFGQYVTTPSNVPVCIVPNELPGCDGVSELNPVQGVTYSYIVETTDATDDVRWFVVNYNDISSSTSDSLINFQNIVIPSGDAYIDPADGSGDYILSLGTYNEYDDDHIGGDGTGISYNGTGSQHQIDIAWKYFDGNLPNEVLLVAYVVSDDECTDNIAVYRIVPSISFTLDVAVLDAAGDSVASPLSTENYADCVSPIESAFYSASDNTPGNGTLTVDYGEDWHFFIVNAANFVDSWLPSFQISYTGDASAVLEASWTYSDAANSSSATWYDIDVSTGSTTNAVIAGGSGGTGTAINAVGDLVNVTLAGECIVVRVKVDHGTLDGVITASTALTFAVTGTMYDGVGSSVSDLYDDASFDDLHYEDCKSDEFTNDVVTVDITPRPQIISQTGTGPEPVEPPTSIN